MADKKDQTDTPTEVAEDDLDDAQGGALRVSSTTQTIQQVSPADEEIVEETRFRSNLTIP